MENWKRLSEYPEHEISDYGKIRRNGKILKLTSDKNGYDIAVISYKGKRNMFRVARLVACSFIPNPENLPTVDHIDRNKANNHVDNLRWATFSTQTNNRDCNFSKGETHPRSCWTEEQVIEIKKLNKTGLGCRKIAKILNCHHRKVQSAISGWKHLDNS
jgi:hypothetical protein